MSFLRDAAGNAPHRLFHSQVATVRLLDESQTCEGEKQLDHVISEFANRSTILAQRALLLLAVLTTTGCASPGGYWASRALDLWDTAPISMQFGGGLSTTLSVTPFLHTGLGYHRAPFSYGLRPKRWGLSSREETAQLVLLGFDDRSIEEGTRRKIWTPKDEKLAQSDLRLQTMSMLVGRRWLPGPCLGGPSITPAPATWLDCEASVFIGVVGIRAGLAPIEFVDFLLGWFGVDILADDLAPARAATETQSDQVE